MKKESKYYIPDISEFVQGFKFEKLIESSGRYDLLIDGEIESLKEWSFETWIPCIVDWKHADDEIITYKDEDMTYTFDGVVANFFSANDDETIIKLLQDGKIRAAE